MTQITELPKTIRDPQTYAIIGAAMEVHTGLGPGFLEAVYQDALLIELVRQHVPVAREVPFSIHYKGVRLRSSYRADFVCFGAILVEVKAVRLITGTDDAQVINYLAVSRLGRAVLFNFGGPSLQFKRFVNNLRHLRNLRTNNP
jgi:GxxExxY protein